MGAQPAETLLLLLRRSQQPFVTAVSTIQLQGTTASTVPHYLLNEAAVSHARRLIDSHQYVLDSEWGDVQPGADEQNAFLKSHSWDEYAAWHLGLTEGAADETKGRYAFVFGDFCRIHRTGLIACVYRASEWRHTDVMRAAFDLLLELDEATG